MPLPSQPPRTPGLPAQDPYGTDQVPAVALPGNGHPSFADPAYSTPGYAATDYDPAATYSDNGYSDDAYSVQDETAGDTYPGESAFDDDEDSDMSPEVLQSAQWLLDLIAEDDSSEVIINGPNEVLKKSKGQRFHMQDIQFGDAETLHKVLNDFVLPYCDTAERIDGRNVLVEGQLELPSGQPHVPPMLARVHILCPPLVQFAKVTIAKKARYEFDLDQIAAKGAMTPQMAEFLAATARGRLTVVVSGPTGAGKTTLLQALTRHFDPNDRVIVIEDTPELRLPLSDVVYLCATQPKPGRKADDIVTTEWLVKATQRMRMDRVIVGECRGAEMAEWLIAANSGAEGSCTTVHADNPRRALDKILGLATKSPTAASEMTLRREIAATVDIVVQAGLIDGRHVITQIEEVSNTIRQDAGLIATQTLFEFDRAKNMHVAKSRPSEDLVNTLKTRGVPVNTNWFRGSLS